MERNNVLLLNPPAEKICIRDYFCSKTSRSNYLFPPIDLLMLSGRLSQDYNVAIIDAIVERLSFSAVTERIKDMHLRAIVSLVGAVSWESDIEFLKNIREVSSASIICIGDIGLENPRELLLKYDCLDAILLDFTNDSLLQYLAGNFDRVENMVIRLDKDVVVEKQKNHSKSTSFDLPIPRHELFLHKGYRFPFARGRLFTAVLTDFGCPYNCGFCVMPALGYKYRSVSNVIDELEYIYNLNIRELFFLDQSFGAARERSKDLCKQIIERGFGFGWTCFSRADLLSKYDLELMKNAGCHTIIIGVESGDEKILKIYKKECDIKKIKEVFQLCRQMEICTVGTFIIGFPEDTEESCLKTIHFAKQLNCDFASFHVAIPRQGTAIRRKAIQMRLIENDLYFMDQSGSVVTMPSYRLTKERIRRLKAKAVREFYLRPEYLIKRIISCDSYKDILEQIYEGWFLLKNI